MRRPLNLLAAAACAMALAKVPTAGALTPRQIAIIVNSNNIGSQEVARYYMQARHVPARNVIGLPLPMTDTIPANFYLSRVAAPIRRALIRRGLKRQIRCLVTTYGIPLRVGPEAPSVQNQREITSIKSEQARVVRHLAKVIAQLNNLGQPPKKAAPPRAPAALKPGAQAAPPNAPATVLGELGPAITKARLRLVKIGEATHPALKQRFFHLVQEAIGPNGLLNFISVPPNAPNRAAALAGLAAIRRQIANGQKQYLALEAHRNRVANRVRMRALQLRFFGLVGLLSQLNQDIPFLSAKGLSTALDSRLMALWTIRRYRGGFVPNPMYLSYYAQLPDKKTPPHILMVSRLDGLTPRNVIKMIATSIRVEKAGLKGVAYFDARGLTGADPYAVFDSNIRHAARFIKKHSHMPVVLNNVPALFQAKNCPNAAIYCGWYSVRHYVNTVQWLPGCVGYHVASFELESLHNPQETGWCINMLDRGVTGTLGAVAEPYLTAFPPPRLFFPLLLSGRYTQAEVYYMTCPLICWRMAFVGDPLYNPFKHDPQISLKTLQSDPTLKIALEEIPPAK